MEYIYIAGTMRDQRRALERRTAGVAQAAAATHANAANDEQKTHELHRVLGHA